PTTVVVEELFGVLRGMFRPLHRNDAVALVFEPADGLPPLYVDEAKVAQILRNLISNALKFTEGGEVRVECRVDDAVGTATFTVTDTGVGIEPDDLVSIFDEFTQIENALQANVRGAGLGLAVCRRLTSVLGGRLDVTSVVGRGSEFTLEIPLVYAGDVDLDELEPMSADLMDGDEVV